nr:hypothetical protein [Tanacetum cinerariifolium]
HGAPKLPLVELGQAQVLLAHGLHKALGEAHSAESGQLQVYQWVIQARAVKADAHHVEIEHQEREAVNLGRGGRQVVVAGADVVVFGFHQLAIGAVEQPSYLGHVGPGPRLGVGPPPVGGQARSLGIHKQNVAGHDGRGKAGGAFEQSQQRAVLAGEAQLIHAYLFLQAFFLGFYYQNIAEATGGQVVDGGGEAHALAAVAVASHGKGR